MDSPRRPRSFWQHLSTEVDRVGAVDVVAERHGVRAGTLSWWRWRLKRDSAAAPSEPSFLPVEIRAPIPTLVDHPVQITVDDVCIGFAVGTDPTYVAVLVTALRGRC